MNFPMAKSCGKNAAHPAYGTFQLLSLDKETKERDSFGAKIHIYPFENVPWLIAVVSSELSL